MKIIIINYFFRQVPWNHVLSTEKINIGGLDSSDSSDNNHNFLEPGYAFSATSMLVTEVGDEMCW